MDIFSRFRKLVSNYKTYATATAGILTALVAWSSDTITATELVVTIFVALQVIFIRAGISKVAEQTVDVVNKAVDEDDV